MSDEHVTLFRKCIDMSAKKSTHLEGGVEEVDVFVTRPGPLGVRLRYHRLIQTPYIALWEDSNHPNPGPLFSAILKLHKEYVIVPVCLHVYLFSTSLTYVFQYRRLVMC